MKHLQAASLGCTYGEDHPAPRAIVHVSRKREEWDQYINSLVGSDKKNSGEVEQWMVLAIIGTPVTGLTKK